MPARHQFHWLARLGKGLIPHFVLPTLSLYRNRHCRCRGEENEARTVGKSWNSIPCSMMCEVDFFQGDKLFTSHFPFFLSLLRGLESVHVDQRNFAITEQQNSWAYSQPVSQYGWWCILLVKLVHSHLLGRMFVPQICCCTTFTHCVIVGNWWERILNLKMNFVRDKTFCLPCLIWCHAMSICIQVYSSLVTTEWKVKYGKLPPPPLPLDLVG